MQTMKTLSSFSKTITILAIQRKQLAFIQGKLPMIDTEGKILLDEDGTIKAADGHGGNF